MGKFLSLMSLVRLVQWAALAALLLIVLSIGADLPGRGPLQAIQAAAHPYRFNVALWEAKNLWDAIPGFGRSKDEAALERYFALSAELRRAEGALRQAEALAAGGDSSALSDALAQRDTLANEQALLEDRARRAIQAKVAEVLREEELSFHLPLGLDFPFPPVAFTFDEAPRTLIVSPRDRIELVESVYIQPKISLEEIEALEEALARHGLSALVERLGGVSTYPALVTPRTDLRASLATTAHEWTHHYLYFTPLGQLYGTSGEMQTINETVANIVGEEVAAVVLGEEPPALREPGETETPRDGGVQIEAFDVRRVLRETRLGAEALLRQGQVAEAEAYMEEQRRLLLEHGVFIRKLNQAYFAFHGVYADSPASISPVNEQLRLLRRQSPSLGAFLRTVAQIRSQRDLEALMAQATVE